MRTAMLIKELVFDHLTAAGHTTSKKLVGPRLSFDQQVRSRLGYLIIRRVFVSIFDDGAICDISCNDPPYDAVIDLAHPNAFDLITQAVADAFSKEEIG